MTAIAVLTLCAVFCATGRPQFSTLRLVGIIALVAVLFAVSANNAQADDAGHSDSLHDAVGVNDVTLVGHLLTIHMADVNKMAGSDLRGSRVVFWSPLHAAAFFGYEEIAGLLIDHGATVSAKDVQGETPLHIAAHFGRTEVLRLLINSGAELDVKDNAKQTALLDALQNHHLKTKNSALLLIEQGADVNETDNAGRAALHYAMEYGDMDIARRLIEKGANINAQENDGDTPLHEAMHHRQVSLALLLIDNGADIDAKNKHDGDTPLHEAAGYRRIDLARLLIDNGADTNAKNKAGITPLSRAGYNTEIAQFLIDKGGQFGTPCPEGQSPSASQRCICSPNHFAHGDPRSFACIAGHAPIMHTFSLHDVAEIGDIDTVAHLLDPTQHSDGAVSINVRDSSGKTPLDLARQGGHRFVMIRLAAAGGNWGDPCTGGKVANPHARPQDGVPECVCQVGTLDRNNDGVCESDSDENIAAQLAALRKELTDLRAELSELRSSLPTSPPGGNAMVRLRELSARAYAAEQNIRTLGGDPGKPGVWRMEVEVPAGKRFWAEPVSGCRVREWEGCAGTGVPGGLGERKSCRPPGTGRATIGVVFACD